MPFDNEFLGHDSIIEKLAVDFVAKAASLTMRSYPDPDSSERVRIEIAFSGVDALNISGDLEALGSNASAGNVNHWHMADGPGTSYFYLVEGYIALTAQHAPVIRII